VFSSYDIYNLQKTLRATTRIHHLSRFRQKRNGVCQSREETFPSKSMEVSHDSEMDTTAELQKKVSAPYQYLQSGILYSYAAIRFEFARILYNSWCGQRHVFGSASSLAKVSLHGFLSFFFHKMVGFECLVVLNEKTRRYSMLLIS
jgi:hypothetical protein